VSVLSRLFRIQPGEGRTVALVVAFMFLSVAGLTIGESGIDALFFDRIGPDSLPVMYLGQGAVGIAGMLALSAALGRFERRRAYVALPLLVAAVVAVERAVVTAGPTWIYPAMWLTTTVAYLVEAVYLWGTAGLVTDTRRAKRLFPLFGAGGILGAVVGGLVTRPLASAIGAENLLAVWAVALTGASALCAVVLGVRGAGPRRRLRSRRPPAVAELRQGFAFVRRSSLLVWMSVAAILFSVLFYSLYLPYAQAATGRFPDPDELAGFFGIFWAAVTAAAFLVSMLLTNRLLGWFGAAAMVLVLPFLYTGAFGVLLVNSTFAVLVAIRFAVNVWLQGVSNPAWETLVNITPEDRRDQTRAFLKGGATQLGTVIAGVVQLIGRGVLTPRAADRRGCLAARPFLYGRAGGRDPRGATAGVRRPGAKRPGRDPPGHTSGGAGGGRDGRSRPTDAKAGQRAAGQCRCRAGGPGAARGARRPRRTGARAGRRGPGGSGTRLPSGAGSGPRRRGSTGPAGGRPWAGARQDARVGPG
jgi:hypothetical protein